MQEVVTKLASEGGFSAVAFVSWHGLHREPNYGGVCGGIETLT
jgi:hypothetical protein